ncbi:hypothetical protein ACIQ7S_03580 [Streptomyces griseoluteus]|uniref:hypothetical protein n=1 Tax=Streptomyces griseoluteus TaxID=29306 RepID=UPI0033165298
MSAPQQGFTVSYRHEGASSARVLDVADRAAADAAMERTISRAHAARLGVSLIIKETATGAVFPYYVPYKGETAMPPRTKATPDVDAQITAVHEVVDRLKPLEPGTSEAQDLKETAESLIRALPTARRNGLRKAVNEAYEAKPVDEPATTQLVHSSDPMTWEGIPELIALGTDRMRAGVDAGLQLTSAGEDVARILLTMRQNMIDPETGLPDLMWRMRATRNAAGLVYDRVLEEISEDDDDRNAAFNSLKRASQNKSSDVLVEWLRGYRRDSAEDMELLRELLPTAADLLDEDEDLTAEAAIRAVYAAQGVELPLRGRAEAARLTRRVEKIQKLTRELSTADADRAAELEAEIAALTVTIPMDMANELEPAAKTDMERVTDSVASARKSLEAAGKRVSGLRGGQKRKAKNEMLALIRDMASTFDLDLTTLVDSEK